MTAAAQRPAAGIALIVLTVTCFAAMDTTIRWLGGTLPVLLMLAARYAVQAASMALWLVLDRRRGFASAHPGFQALRGVLLLVTSGFSFVGVQHMPVAEFTAIIMLTPVLVTLLGAWLLHEPVSRLRWALVAGGFAGALVVIRPGSGLFGWAALYPLGGAVTYAAFQVLTRRLAGSEDPYTTHFWTGFTGIAALLPLCALSGVPASLASLGAAQAGWLLWIGALGTGGHLMLILAMGFAPTATLMPFVFVQIVVAAAFGALVFHRLPDGWGWVGMALIAACGAASAWLNTRSQPPAPVTADTTSG